jgi:tetratricopeptide (TPR) repeat protein
MFVQTACAQQERSPKYIFFKGNTYYEEGRYDKAIEVYSQLLDEGYESGNLYFNLGNSYFKKGELGRAILYYEKAGRLIPRDGDLKANYQFAQSNIKYNVFEQSSWLKRASDTFNMFTINEIAIILSILTGSFFLFLTVSIFIDKVKRYSYIAIVVLIIFVIPFALSLYSKIAALDGEVIIVAESVQAKFEPLDNATTHFTLYEGMKLYILELKKDWIKIKRHDGKTGWVKDDTAAKI